MKTKEKKEVLSLRQEKVVAEIEKCMLYNKPIDKKAILLKCGYSETTASGIPHKIFNSEGVQRALRKSDVINRFKEERQKALDRLSKTIDKASYKDLISAIDILSKNYNLLRGLPTANQQNSLLIQSDDDLRRQLAKDITRLLEGIDNKQDLLQIFNN